MTKNASFAARIENFADIKNFFFAGKAIFTLKSTVSDKHYTFQIKRPDEDKPDFYFVSALTGGDNNTNYSYFGYISHGKFSFSNKSRLNKTSAAVSAFEWFYANFLKGGISSKVEFWHESKCGCCGRKLTTPQSIASGLGPVCQGRYEAVGC